MKMTFREMGHIAVKTLLLLVVFNLLFAVLFPVGSIGGLSLYNSVFPGRQRFPFGENPRAAYNLSLYNLDAMFASHIVNQPAPADEFRILMIGDSATWGTLLKPQQTRAGQLDALRMECGGKNVRVYNLGYPTLSLTKDLMILDEAMHLQPDLIIWSLTLEAFPVSRQLDSPIAANNPQRIQRLIHQYNLPLDGSSLAQPTWWDRTIFGQRRQLADLLRLQLYGLMWASTGIDQEYPADYPPAQRDFEPGELDFHEFTPPTLPDEGMALDVISAAHRMAGGTPILLVNEPILISSGENSDERYNFYYPRWAYDQYRQRLAQAAEDSGWWYVDLWDLAPEGEFTNSAIHLTPAGEARVAQALVDQLTNAAGNLCLPPTP